VGFLALTNRGIYRHVEYDGVLTQLQSIAERFGPRDVLLFHSGSRDEPDLVVTPLKYAFGVDAFTIKNGRPDRYAPQLADYVRHWQEQGRRVYLIFGSSGGFGLPGLQLEPAGRVALEHLAEFEQLQDQKPHNVQDFNLDFAAYQLAATGDQAAAIPRSIAADEYAAQVSGLYRAEQIAGVPSAWTQGDALLRLPWPDAAPHEIRLRLAGGVRPAALGQARACLEFWPETNYRVDPPATIAGDLGCLELSEHMGEYTLALDPRRYSAAAPDALLLRIRSDTWVPAQADPAQIDRRTLGVQFGGLTIATP
jgi:hypothetical protein